MGYFDKLEINHAETTHQLWCKLNDDTPVLKISCESTSIQTTMILSIYLYDSQTNTTTEKTVSLNAERVISDIYVTDHGAYLKFKVRSNPSTTSSAGAFISKTNNDTTGLFVAGISENRLATESWACDDDPNYSGSYTFPTVYIRNQTTLMNVPTAGSSESISYFPYIYYMLTSQLGYENNSTTPPCNIFQNGYRYLWVGYYMLRDDPPINS